MTWNEYCDIKYENEKEYHYYSTFACGPHGKEHDREMYHRYVKLDNNLYEFEKAVMNEALKKISKEDFKKMLDK